MRRATHAAALWVATLTFLVSACSNSPSATTTARQPTRPTAARLGPTSTASSTAEAAPAPTATATLVPIPSPSPQEPVRGPSNANTTLLVYSDFDCDLCAQVAGTIGQVQRDHPRDLQYVFRPFPLLAVHEKSAQAVAALFAAQDQGAYWNMHDLLFQSRQEWANLETTEFRSWLLERAETEGVDPRVLAEDMTRATTLEAIENAYRGARASGVPGVPFLLLNGRPHLLPLDHQHLEAAVRLALLERQQFSEAPSSELDPTVSYRALLEFDVGEVIVQLYPQASPKGVSSFVHLAEAGWYNDTVLYRIVPGQIVEGGDPTATGLADAGYHFDSEINPALTFDQAGMVGLVNEGPGSNSARFFITLRARPDLNASQTIIGRVIAGMQYLQDLEAREPIEDLLEPPPVVLKRVVIQSR